MAIDIIRDFLRLPSSLQLPFRRKSCDLPPDLAPCNYGCCRPNEAFFVNSATSSRESSSTLSDSSSRRGRRASTSRSTPSPQPTTTTGTSTSTTGGIVISSYSAPVQVPILSIPKPRKRSASQTRRDIALRPKSSRQSMGSKKSKMTLVEIFQSQGCSSCPPANSNVIELMNNYPSILVLTYEVTYWDYLGWKDVFGNKEFDRRQRDYAGALGNETVFTPQVIVNGRADGVGNTFKDLNKIVSQGVMAAANEDTVRVDTESNAILVSGRDADEVADVHLVRYMPNPPDVDIRRGENAGRCLPHRNVVVDIKKIGEWRGGSTVFNIGDEKQEGIERAVLVQKGRGGAVIGVAKLE
ncbi:hypothetical protein TWF102_007579 [Orbilia oligospora]|uniref:DUF1223-domain-containing protein n=1 Tax=Orbilia oligospora TaxID=2813651 RepID=A0A7C8N644_ORBOL|nr:hypothetical protein TWF706_011863 [Orbilia oligospora]KAF3087372.1 hypothetical protein TWF103_001411 [Orbilia oligospora]KAF3094463.1 hypothetical protein TWF102_007579 [Orbilia oligospora]KAF3145338.1 hypothetical protein TWF594_004285 [Orbilia oligospora]